MDLLAAGAAVLAAVMLVVYLSLIRQQEGEPALWAVAALVIGVLASGYGAIRSAPHRRPLLLVAGLALLALGVLAILSIGWPIIVAGALSLVAAARARSARGQSR